jgi:capsular exopolysaccharide synthesis family protein
VDVEEGITTFTSGEVVRSPWEGIEAPSEPAAAQVHLSVRPSAGAHVRHSTQVGSTPPASPVFPSEKPAAKDTTPPIVRLEPATFSAAVADKVVVSNALEHAAREQYRRLAAALHHAQVERECGVIMTTSSVPQEGKTLSTLNLGLTLSESLGRNVLLVDCDLRQPALHTAFSVSAEPGLPHALIREDWRFAARKVRNRLTLLTAGRASEDPMSTLTSAAFKKLIEDARKSFHWILIDTPPVGLLSDAKLLTGVADLVLLVAATTTRYDLVQKAVQGIGQDRIFGVVLNRAEPTKSSMNAYYQAYSGRSED